MEKVEVKIELYNERLKSTTTIYVEQLAENKFRMADNDTLNYRSTLGTEFETRINKDGKHEVITITKESDFVTKRFLLNSNH